MDVRSLKDEAAEFFRKGRFAKAAERYAALVKAEPKDAQHLIKLGDSLRRDGKREDAIEVYRRAVDTYAQQGVVIKAIAACKLVLEIDPEQKDAQEALANLCAKRYVKPELRPTPPRPPPVNRYAPIELPEADESEEIAFENEVGELQPPPPPRRSPPPAPAREIVELAEITLEPVEPAPPASLGARRRPEPELEEIELDLGLSLESASTPEPVDSHEVMELIPIEEEDFVAENTEAHQILRDAAEAARRPATTMADILSESLLIEGDDDDGEEIELLTVTAGTPPPAPIRDEQRQREEEEMRRLANEAAFELQTPLPEGEPEPEPEPESETPPLPDFDQQMVPLFSELPPEAFVDLLEKLEFRRVEAGEVILREGDEGKSIFVLASGKARVVKGHGSPTVLELATLDDGAFFGEMALLTGAPRVASVVASEDSEVLVLSEQLLRELTARHPSVAQSLKKFYRQRLLSNVMAISPIFRAFDKGDRKMLVEKFKLREAKSGEAIISEGEKPDGLYVVMHGVCLVTKTAPESGRKVPLAVLREGDVFGEMSLLSKKPASASVTAKRRTLVLRLPKAVFDELMFTHPAVLEVVSELTDERARVNERILKGEVPEPHEAVALL